MQSLADASPSSYLDGSDLGNPVAPPPPAPVNGCAPAQIAAVYTAADFQRALHAGVRDIELRAHVDTRQLEQQRSAAVGIVLRLPLGAVRETTRSIRVCPDALGHLSSFPLTCACSPVRLTPLAVQQVRSCGIACLLYKRVLDV